MSEFSFHSPGDFVIDYDELCFLEFSLDISKQYTLMDFRLFEDDSVYRRLHLVSSPVISLFLLLFSYTQIKLSLRPLAFSRFGLFFSPSLSLIFDVETSRKIDKIRKLSDVYIILENYLIQFIYFTVFP